MARLFKINSLWAKHDFSKVGLLNSMLTWLLKRPRHYRVSTVDNGGNRKKATNCRATLLVTKSRTTRSTSNREQDSPVLAGRVTKSRSASRSPTSSSRRMQHRFTIRKPHNFSGAAKMRAISNTIRSKATTRDALQAFAEYCRCVEVLTQHTDANKKLLAELEEAQAEGKALGQRHEEVRRTGRTSWSNASINRMKLQDIELSGKCRQMLDRYGAAVDRHEEANEHIIDVGLEFVYQLREAVIAAGIYKYFEDLGLGDPDAFWTKFLEKPETRQSNTAPQTGPVSEISQNQVTKDEIREQRTQANDALAAATEAFEKHRGGYFQAKQEFLTGKAASLDGSKLEREQKEFDLAWLLEGQQLTQKLQAAEDQMWKILEWAQDARLSHESEQQFLFPSRSSDGNLSHVPAALPAGYIPPSIEKWMDTLPDMPPGPNVGPEDWPDDSAVNKLAEPETWESTSCVASPLGQLFIRKANPDTEPPVWGAPVGEDRPEGAV